MTREIKIRKRFFLGGEGSTEQSLVKWYQNLCDQKELHVHLEYSSLFGGGYNKMLREMLRLRERKQSLGTLEQSILLVDEDRSLNNDDPWSVEKLKEEAEKKNIKVCVHQPKIEGFFLRLFPRNEQLKPSAQEVEKLLVKIWPNYTKNINANELSKKFTFEDLLRVAKYDSDVSNLLLTLGLI
jgi:hypothetical protein